MISQKMPNGAAMIQPFEVDDLVLGKKVSISVGEQYAILRIGNRYYYFVRETGELDGTGADFYCKCEAVTEEGEM